MFFRPEEVDRRSERVKRLASLVAALSEPDHPASGLAPHTFRRRSELQRFATVMAGRFNLNRFADHWRESERVGRATGVSLSSARESHNEGCSPSRERVGDVYLPCADPNDVVLVECD
jgi:hypothetical protein